MARFFNGTTQYLNNTATPPITGYPFTASIWVRVNADPSSNDFNFWQIQDKDVEGHYFRMSTDIGSDQLKVRVSAEDGASARSTTDITQGVWHHCCATFTATLREAYLDGGGKGTNDLDRTPANIDSMDIGHEGDSTPDDEMSGDLAELTMWNVVLSEPEIVALASGIHPLRIRPTNVKLYYDLYGLNSPELERTGTGYNMTLVAGPTRSNHPPTVPFSARFWGGIPFFEMAGPAPPPTVLGGKRLADSRNWSRDGRGVAKLNALTMPIGEKVNYFTPADTTTILELDPGSSGLVVVEVEAGSFRCKTGTLAARTFTAMSEDDTLTIVGHTYQNGQGPLRVSNSGGALPTGLLADTDYWIRDATADTFRLALTRNGPRVTITADGMGTHTIGGDDGAAADVGFTPSAPVAAAAAVTAIGVKKLRLDEIRVFDTPVSIVGEAGSGDILAWWTA